MSNGVSECSCRRINWKCPTVIRILDHHLIHNRPNEETLKLLHEHTSVLCSNSVFRKHVATRRRELFSKEEHVNLQYIMDNVAKEDLKDDVKLVAEKRPATNPPDFNVVESIDTTVAAYWKRRRLEQDCKFLETATDLSGQSSNEAASPAVSAETRHNHPKINDGDSSSTKLHQISSHATSSLVPPVTPSLKSSHSKPKTDDTLLLNLNKQNVNNTTSKGLPTTTPPAMPSRMVASHSKISDCASSSSPNTGLPNNSHGVSPNYTATVNHPLTVSHSFSTFPKIDDGASSSKVQSHGKPSSFTKLPIMSYVASSSKPTAPPTASQGFITHPKINHGTSSSADPLKLPSRPFYNPPRRFILDEAERVRFSELIRKNAHFVEAPPNMPIVKNLLDHFRNS